MYTFILLSYSKGEYFCKELAKCLAHSPSFHNFVPFHYFSFIAAGRICQNFPVLYLLSKVTI